MDESRRHAEAWAAEWRLRKRNRTIVTIIVVLIVAIVAIGAVGYFSTRISRSTYSSAEEMKAAVQGRYAIESSYTDLIIEDDEITLTYLAYSHYNRDYAERYGYDADEDNVLTDHVVKWDYKHGVLKTEWMDDLIIDKDGNIHRGKYTVLYKTDRPRPEPIDPATLEHPEGDPEYVTPEETYDEAENRVEEIEEATEAAAAFAESKGAATETTGEAASESAEAAGEAAEAAGEAAESTAE